MKYIIGTSGWMYDDWSEQFYPENVKKNSWLKYYSKKFDTVEINNSFYKLPSKKTFKNWKESSAAGFTFSVKANRYITHMKKLSDPEESLRGLLENINGLDNKLGPILFQLPPFWYKDKGKLAEFVEHIPEQLEAAFEFRHNSWYDNEVFEILKKKNIALVFHDHADAPSPKDIVTSNFCFIRFHGPDGSYTTKYNNEQLGEWSAIIHGLKNVNKVYCYFNNDNKGFAIKNAIQLRELLT